MGPPAEGWYGDRQALAILHLSSNLQAEISGLADEPEQLGDQP